MRGLTELDIKKIDVLREKMIQATNEVEVKHYSSQIHEILDQVDRRLESVQKAESFIKLVNKKKWRLSIPMRA
ncbi:MULTISPECIES: hypothetical protein [Metabacillus]|uniref:hypothetical protein n=1 Tax=Metabacillus TaxID=2675233 RepID=UPI000C80FB56|nr:MULTISPECIES: hypothetical protein [Metabacillus]MCM3444001.1 hypothetical protein [Metabacillus halosaccharovorans]PMC34948.1 hypothetical protein CJ195_20790 [Bacillus sp. UMB0899]